MKLTQLKGMIQYILTNNFCYFLLVRWNIKNNFINKGYAYISVANQSSFLKALIFFGVYERKERVIINKYLKSEFDDI